MIGHRMTKIGQNRRGQEEIVGFVAIVVLMAIVLLVVLGFSVRNSSVSVKESRDVSNFIYSSMEYTSGCALQYEPAYSKLGELLKECYQKNKCITGEDACTVFQQDFTRIVDSSYRIDPDRPLKGYIFNVSYQTNSSAESIFVLSKGECKGSREGAEYITPVYPGDIIGSFELCS